MSAHESVVSEVRQRPITESRPDIAMAAGDAVLRAVASLDAASRIAVLEWALVQVKRGLAPTGRLPMTIFERHAVTLGQHDAEISQWEVEGASQAVMAARLGCSRAVVNARVRAMRRKVR